jgi:crotonobetainyl-CoA:carnitine CoA-transferase CaiB-like acyl-CoA transferase
LADWGADVIKIETPLAGDYARMAPAELGFGGIFEAVNRGKRSIAVDYRKPAGRDLVLELAQTADVLIESSRPGQLDKRGLGADAVRSVNELIVYCSLSGFGQTGPHRDKPGHDIDYLAMSGVLSLMAPPGERPMPAALQLADVSAGTQAAARILAALVGRSATGLGCYLDLAVVDAPMAWLDTLGAGIETAGREVGPMSGAYPCYATYQASDGRWLAVGALELPFWVAFCRGLGRDDLTSRAFDPAAASEVAAIIAERSSSDWVAAFEDDACVALVRLPDEALEDEHLQRRTPVRTAKAPRLGADTDAVLAESGVDPKTRDGLVRSGVVAPEQTPERAARAARLGSLMARMAERGKAAAA